MFHLTHYCLHWTFDPYVVETIHTETVYIELLTPMSLKPYTLRQSTLNFWPLCLWNHTHWDSLHWTFDLYVSETIHTEVYISDNLNLSIIMLFVQLWGKTKHSTNIDKKLDAWIYISQWWLMHFTIVLPRKWFFFWFFLSFTIVFP